MLWTMGGQTEVKTTAKPFEFLLSSSLTLICLPMGQSDAHISEIICLGDFRLKMLEIVIVSHRGINDIRRSSNMLIISTFY